MTDSIKYPLPTAEREDLEESLGLIWHKRESGDTSVPSLREALSAAGNAAAWDRLRNEGFVAEIDGRARLTDKGESTAAAVIRRHRLAERLLTDVLNLDRAVIDPNACVLEHILSAEVSESICTLLGHPAECPHGLAIPAGDCCRRNADQLSPIVEPLSRLKAGQSGRVAYLQLKDHPELHRLMALGLVPGADLKLHQTYPAFVLDLGETQLALEEAVAGRIFVRRA
ncbi:MAG: DtxR family transcriptional regulator [Elusimicrobia bacterium]|jgi:DtxR family Mn-dependent transcriptional regulator|nr:MAG: DtxR family transcriptional regulator [Elusimicrobiota bacterium]